MVFAPHKKKKNYGEIAVNCMLDKGTERPSMNDIVWGLEFAMQLHQNAENNDRVGGTIMKKKNEEVVSFINNENNNNNSDWAFTCSCENITESKSSSVTKMVSRSKIFVMIMD